MAELNSVELIPSDHKTVDASNAMCSECKIINDNPSKMCQNNDKMRLSSSLSDHYSSTLGCTRMKLKRSNTISFPIRNYVFDSQVLYESMQKLSITSSKGFSFEPLHSVEVNNSAVVENKHKRSNSISLPPVEAERKRLMINSSIHHYESTDSLNVAMSQGFSLKMLSHSVETSSVSTLEEVKLKNSAISSPACVGQQFGPESKNNFISDSNVTIKTRIISSMNLNTASSKQHSSAVAKRLKRSNSISFPVIISEFSDIKFADLSRYPKSSDNSENLPHVLDTISTCDDDTQNTSQKVSISPPISDDDTFYGSSECLDKYKDANHCAIQLFFNHSNLSHLFFYLEPADTHLSSRKRLRKQRDNLNNDEGVPIRVGDRFSNNVALLEVDDKFDINYYNDKIWYSEQLSIVAVILNESDELKAMFKTYRDIDLYVPCFVMKNHDFVRLKKLTDILEPVVLCKISGIQILNASESVLSYEEWSTQLSHVVKKLDGTKEVMSQDLPLCILLFYIKSMEVDKKSMTDIYNSVVETIQVDVNVVFYLLFYYSFNSDFKKDKPRKRKFDSKLESLKMDQICPVFKELMDRICSVAQIKSDILKACSYQLEIQQEMSECGMRNSRCIFILSFIRMYFEEIFGLPCDCQELKISWKALLQLTISQENDADKSNAYLQEVVPKVNKYLSKSIYTHKITSNVVEPLLSKCEWFSLNFLRILFQESSCDFHEVKDVEHLLKTSLPYFKFLKVIDKAEQCYNVVHDVESYCTAKNWSCPENILKEYIIFTFGEMEQNINIQFKYLRKVFNLRSMTIKEAVMQWFKTKGILANNSELAVTCASALELLKNEELAELFKEHVHELILDKVLVKVDLETIKPDNLKDLLMTISMCISNKTISQENTWVIIKRLSEEFRVAHKSTYSGYQFFVLTLYEVPICLSSMDKDIEQFLTGFFDQKFHTESCRSNFVIEFSKINSVTKKTPESIQINIFNHFLKFLMSLSPKNLEIVLKNFNTSLTDLQDIAIYHQDFILQTIAKLLNDELNSCKEIWQIAETSNKRDKFEHILKFNRDYKQHIPDNHSYNHAVNRLNSFVKQEMIKFESSDYRYWEMKKLNHCKFFLSKIANAVDPYKDSISPQVSLMCNNVDKCLAKFTENKTEIASLFIIPKSYDSSDTIESVLTLYGISMPGTISLTTEMELMAADGDTCIQKLEKYLGSIKISDVIRLEKTLQKFLSPLRDIKYFMLHFHYKNSQLFRQLLLEKMGERKINLLSDLIDSLMSIKQLFDKILLKGDFCYQNLRPLQNFSKAIRSMEIKILLEFSEYSHTSNDSKFMQLDQLLALIQLESGLKYFISLCENYKLLSCQSDEKFNRIKDIIERMKNKESLTVDTSFADMTVIRETFDNEKKHMSDDERLVYFELIKELSESYEFYRFLSEKGFLEKPGLFAEHLNFVTTSLQQEEYESEVLNHLTPAFNLVRQLDEKLPFNELIVHIFQSHDANLSKRQLERVRNDISSIEKWFSGIDDDYLEATIKNLKAINECGCYKISPTLKLCLSFQVQKYNSNTIKKFVQRLAFVGSDHLVAKDSFLERYKIALQLLDLYTLLQKSGHHEYTKTHFEEFNCSKGQDMIKKVTELKDKLSKWTKHIEEAQYSNPNLLLVNTRKMRRIFKLLEQIKVENPHSTCLISQNIMKEVSFLQCQRSHDDYLREFQKVQMIVKDSDMISSKELTDKVGQFLSCFCSSPFISEPSELLKARGRNSVALLHKCPDSTIYDRMKFILCLYADLPSPLQLFQCQLDTSKEEIKIFLDRCFAFQGWYIINGIDKLTAQMQEELASLYVSKTTDITESTGTCINFIQTQPTLIEDAPRVFSLPMILDNVEEECNIKLWDDCYIELVYGTAGIGKTHYIKTLPYANERLCITINESFTIEGIIEKLDTLYCMNCTISIIHFNFTLVPPGENVHQDESQQFFDLLEKIGWFMFDLLLLRYVEDKHSGLSFSLLHDRKYQIFIEVPSVIDECYNIYEEKKIGEKNLEYFRQKLPVFNFIGKTMFILSDIPFNIKTEDQIVFKYLKAYTLGWIDLGYQVCGEEESPQEKSWREAFCSAIEKTLSEWIYNGVEIAFGQLKDLSSLECAKLLENEDIFPTEITKKKLIMTQYIGYLRRRCNFLNNSVYMKFNSRSKFGSTLFTLMIQEAKDFCLAPKTSWSSSPHQQILYEGQEKGGCFKIITTKPANINEEDFETWSELKLIEDGDCDMKSRETLDNILARGLELPVKIQHERLKIFDDHEYVLTLDYALKMLTINERLLSGTPVVIEGETGVGKTKLLEMLSLLHNVKLINMWNIVRGEIETLLNEGQGFLKAAGYSSLIKAQDAENPFINIRKKILEIHQSFLFTTLTPNSSLSTFLDDIESEDIAMIDNQRLLKTLRNLLSCEISLFHKLEMHAGLNAVNITDFVKMGIKRANLVNKAYSKERDILINDFPLEPSILLYFDEINTSSALGLIKELLVDKTLHGVDLPSNLLLIGACNPFREETITKQRQKHVFLPFKTSYYVRKMHPSINLIKWDYGALDEEQEQDYIVEKMKLVKSFSSTREKESTAKKKTTREEDKVSSIDKVAHEHNIFDLTWLILKSQRIIRDYAEKEIKDKISKNDAKLRAKSIVSQRDIQRFFKCCEWFIELYNIDSRFENDTIEVIKERSVLMSLGLVYSLRLPDRLKHDYSDAIDRECKTMNVLLFSTVFQEELDWFTKQFRLPKGIAETVALKQNILATVVACANKIPLIIVGEPGTSKTLSFNLTIDNLKGKESINTFFKNNCHLFPSLHPFFYQCSQRSTSEDIERIFALAIGRQHANQNSNINTSSVVFMDEAGLPEERHESLKVLHYYLDKPEVSFVAITNDPLDAAKSNRAICVFRPATSIEDLQTLAISSSAISEKIPSEKEHELLEHFCKSFYELMKDKEFNYRNFFGLRDFVNFISYIHRQQGSKKAMTTQLALESLERNLNGHQNFDMICEMMLKTKSQNIHLKRRDVLNIIKDSLNDKIKLNKKNEGQQELYSSRYMLIIDESEDESAMRLLFVYGILDHSVKIHMCSEFMEESDLNVNTIADIKHSARNGDTVVLCQTDSIHESFYELFNQRFRIFKNESKGTVSLFANISVGSYTKLCKIDPNFQCIVVIPKASLLQVPRPFLNRFEKYSLSYTAVYNTKCKASELKMFQLVHLACEKVQELIELCQGSKAFYGYTPRHWSQQSHVGGHDTLYSLVLSILPLHSSYALHCNFDEYNCVHMPVVNETDPEWLKNNFSTNVVGTIVKVLKEKAGFFLPEFDQSELHEDSKWIFHHLSKDPYFANVLKNEFSICGAVGEAFDILHAPSMNDIVTDESCFVIAVIVQWLTCYVTKRMLQLLTPEALILNEKMLQTHYINAYLNTIEHFDIMKLVENRLAKVKTCECRSLCVSNKLICYTRSSTETSSLSENSGEFVYLRVTSSLSDHQLNKSIERFLQSHGSWVFFASANMQENAASRLNRFRIIVEEKERAATRVYKCRKLFVLLLHFSPSQLYDPCYPALFLAGWDYFYLDSLRFPGTKKQQTVNIKECIKQCVTEKDGLPNECFDLKELLQDSIPIVSSRVVLTREQIPESHFNKQMSVKDRQKQLQFIFMDLAFSEIVYEVFSNLWSENQMASFLVHAAEFTTSFESSLSISSYIHLQIQALFCDFLVYFLACMNENGNLDIILQENPKSNILNFCQGFLLHVQMPELKYIPSRSRTLEQTKLMRFQFPFFHSIFDEMESITKASYEKLLKPQSEVEKLDQIDFECALKREIKQRLYALKLANSKQELKLKVLVSGVNVFPNFCYKYFTDFAKLKLHINNEDVNLPTLIASLQIDTSESIKVDPVEWLSELHADFEINKVNYGHSLKQIRLLKDAIRQDEALALSLFDHHKKVDFALLVKDIVQNGKNILSSITNKTGYDGIKWYEALRNIIHIRPIYELLQKSQEFESVYAVYVMIYIHDGRMPSFLSDFIKAIQEVKSLGKFIEFGCSNISCSHMAATYIKMLIAHFFYDPSKLCNADFSWFLKESIGISENSVLRYISIDTYKYYLEQTIFSKISGVQPRTSLFVKEKKKMVEAVLHEVKSSTVLLSIHTINLLPEITSNTSLLAKLYFEVMYAYYMKNNTHYHLYTALREYENVDKESSSIEQEQSTNMLEKEVMLRVIFYQLGCLSLKTQTQAVNFKSLEMVEKVMKDIEENLGIIFAERYTKLIAYYVWKQTNDTTMFIRNVKSSKLVDVPRLKRFLSVFQNIEVSENVSLLLALINKKNIFLLLYADVKLFLNEICDETGQSQSLQDIISKWAHEKIHLSLEHESPLELNSSDAVYMCLWLNSVFEFYLKKKRIPKNIFDFSNNTIIPFQLASLMQCFFDPETISERAETSFTPDEGIIELDDSTTDDKILRDPISDFFQNCHDQKLERDCVCVLANVIGIMIGIGAEKTNLWHHLFSPMALNDTFVPGILSEGRLSKQNCYNSGVLYTVSGEYGRLTYEKRIEDGNLNIHALMLLQWMNMGALTLGHLSQNKFNAEVAEIFDIDYIRQYCLNQMTSLWKFLQTHFQLSIEQLHLISIKTFVKQLQLNGLQPVLCDEMSQLQQFENRWQLAFFSSLNDVTSQHSQYLHMMYFEEPEQFLFRIQPDVFDDMLMPDSESILEDFLNIDTLLPTMLTEDQLISALEIQIHQPELDCDKNCLAFLKLFLFNYSHLKAAGSLLCPLIEFYRCLHTSLHYQITKESVRNITLSNSIERFGSDKLQNTFENFQGLFNRYVLINPDAVAVGEFHEARESRRKLGIASAMDRQKLFNYLTLKKDKLGILFDVIQTIIDSQNRIMNKIFNTFKDSPHQNRHFSSKSSIGLSEIDENSTIVNMGSRDAFFGILKRCIKSKNSFDLKMLQDELLDTYISGKQFIVSKWDDLLIYFHFKADREKRNKLNPTEILLKVNLEEMFTNYPQIMKPIEGDNLKCLDFLFSSADFDTIVGLAHALISIGEHMYKMLEAKEFDDNFIESVCKNPMYSLFETVVYGLSETSDHRDAFNPYEATKLLSESQKKFFTTVNGCHFVSTVKCLVEWIEDGTYDFFDLPMALKRTISKEFIPSIHKAFQEYTIEELEFLQEALHHLERTFQSEVNSLSKKSLTKMVLEKFHFRESEIRILHKIPPTILIENYVSFRIQIRRLLRRLHEKKDKDKKPRQQWFDSVSGLWMSDHFKSIREMAKPFDYSEIYDVEHGFLADCVSSEDEQFEEKSIVTVQPSLLPERLILSDIANSLTTSDIVEYLKSIKLQDMYEESFIENDVNGNMMLTIYNDNEALKELGVNKALHRAKIKANFGIYLESISKKN